jgi:hypothetical protein
MKREDCWRTFSEALIQFLSARDCLLNRTAGWKQAEEQMREAAEHMDALTGNEL